MDRLRKLGSRWPWFGRVLDVHERVGEVNGGAMASSVTLTVFVSLFPLALATIAVIGFLAAGDADVPGKIVDNLSLTGAAADTVTDAIGTAQESRRTASIIGFLGLLWSGLNVTTAVATAVRLPWQVKPVGIKGKVNGLLWLVGGVVLGGGGVALGAVLGFMPDWAPKVLTSSSALSHRAPSMMDSWVSFVAPFQEIFTSEARGTIFSAHARAPRRGKVPLVVRLHLIPCSRQTSRICSKCS